MALLIVLGASAVILFLFKAKRDAEIQANENAAATTGSLGDLGNIGKLASAGLGTGEAVTASVAPSVAGVAVPIVGAVVGFGILAQKANQPQIDLRIVTRLRMDPTIEAQYQADIRKYGLDGALSWLIYRYPGAGWDPRAVEHARELVLS